VGGWYSLCQKYCSPTRYPQSLRHFSIDPTQRSSSVERKAWEVDRRMDKFPASLSCSRVAGRYPEPVQSTFNFSVFVTVHRRPGWRHPFLFSLKELHNLVFSSSTPMVSSDRLTLRNLDKSKELYAFSLCSFLYALHSLGSWCSLRDLEFKTSSICLSVDTAMQKTSFQIRVNHLKDFN